MVKKLPLSNREKEILRVINQGNNVGQTAKALNLSTGSVVKYIKHAKERLGLPPGAGYKEVATAARTQNAL